MATQVNLDNATRVDITCRKGDTFTLEFTFTDSAGAAIDLTGYVWKMDVKETDTSSGDIIADNSFDYTGADPAVGKLKITATAATMAGVSGGLYVYDLQSTASSVVKTWVYGLFKVNEDVSE
jgi:hypothetical protein|tara:strand:+ start:1237 stop:1602 length:366 start_codon:yes stop_codon:yes gene_type:complete